MMPAAPRRCVLRLMVILAFLPMISRSPALAAEEAPTLPAPTPDVPPARRLTLEEAKQLALADNKSLALAHLSIEEKRHIKAAAWKDYFPKILGNVTYLRFNDNLGSVVTVPNLGLGLVAPGTTISTNAVRQNSTFTTALVAQPITKLIAVNAAVQIARADEIAARAQLDKGTRDLLSGVAQAYYALLGAQRIETALSLQVQMLEGLVKATPLPALRIGLLEAQQGLVQVRGQARELTDQLDNLLNLPPCTRLELVDPIPVEPPVRCADDAAQVALANSPEVRAAQQDVAKARAALQVARMDYIPDVLLFGGYQNQSAIPIIQPNISFLGVTANYTFWEWGKRKNITNQRKTQIALAEQNVQVTMDKVALEARKSYNSFEQAREAYQLAGAMVQARKEAEKTAIGKAAVQAKAETAKAELDQMKAEIAYRVAYAQLAALICVE
ncbi:MAG TPA: TolC family protein [Gemmataceae bacterium]